VSVTIRCRVDPPVCSVADAALKVTALLEISAPPVEARPLDGAVAVVGSAALARRALEATDGARAWTPRGLRDRTQEPVQPFSTLHGALESAGDADIERILLLVTRPMLGASDALPALEKAAEEGVAFDFVCAGPDVDSGPLQRLITRVGGEVIDADGLRGHLDQLRRSACRALQVQVAFAQDIEAQRLFRVAPRPRAVDAVRFDERAGSLSWDAGALPASGALIHTLEMAVPRRRIGTHRLARVAVLDGGTQLAAVDVTIRCSPDPSEAAYVEPGVVRARERAESAWLVEEVSTAYRNGDGRMVSMLLDRLVRYFASAGRAETADELWRARIGFLRTGLLPLSVLRWLRRAIA